MTARPVSQQILRLVTGGDPAVICPAAGYILNPIDETWTLLCSFQTNSPYTTTFDPTIVASSGQYAWDLGDGTFLIGDKAVSHTYLSTATRTVKIYGKGTCNITSIDFSNDSIVGTLNLSNSAFATLTSIQIGTNASMTSVVFPSICTGTVSLLGISTTGVTGTLDLSMFDKFSTSAYIGVATNASMTSVVFASSVTGTLSGLDIFSDPGITSLNLSMFSSFTSSANIQIMSNPAMTGITWASSITGTFSLLNLSTTGLVGTLDLSKFSAFTTSASIDVHANSAMTGITWASSITGTFATLNLHTTGLVGTLDLSKFSAFTSSATIYVHTNPAMTGITWASSITGTFVTLSIHTTGFSGTLDLSKFSNFSNTASVLAYSNPSMQGITFSPSTINGFIRNLSLYSCGINTLVDISKLKTGVASLAWRVDSNSLSAAIVNQILVDIDSISTSGFTSRVINISGTNAAPDTTSGGYNGVAAKTSLQGKGFTVTSN